jgi:hypothetical protein
VNWRAAHEGPERFLARSEHSDWGCARRWLLEMMLLSPAPGIEAALHALARAPPECDCLFQAEGHSFALVGCTVQERREVSSYA